jgi:uncharacterized protein VirK/YbjX
MVFGLLTRHWMARRHYPFASWAACIVRSLRVLLFRRAHAELLAMDVYRNYVTQVHDDVFHHLSHRNYLARGLSLRQRVRCVLTHYRFEDATFDAAYKHAVYRDGGLVLWQHEADGSKVEVRLGMAQRLNAEGDLTLTLMANGKRVHRLSFSWVDERFAGLAGLGIAGILPFIARNQGHRADEADALDAFRRAYPANSPLVTTPGFFCCAALQGIAQALGMDHVVAVKSAWHCAWTPSDARYFTTAYDDVWRNLGGTEMPGRAWHLALPFEAKPLAEIPSRHRKRAALRRAYWRRIGDAAGMALREHIVQTGSIGNAHEKPQFTDI